MSFYNRMGVEISRNITNLHKEFCVKAHTMCLLKEIIHLPTLYYKGSQQQAATNSTYLCSRNFLYKNTYTREITTKYLSLKCILHALFLRLMLAWGRSLKYPVALPYKVQLRTLCVITIATVRRSAMAVRYFDLFTYPSEVSALL